MDITSTLGMQTEQHLPDVDMLEEDESYLRNCEPENSHMQFATEAKARGSYRRYTPQQSERLFDLVIEEGRSAKEAALMAGINIRAAQNYVKIYRDDEQKRLPGIERKPRTGCPGKLSETHTRFLTQLVNQNLTAVLHSTRCCVFRQGSKSL
ncbi:hypothetical protein BX070DRAFT_229504 [Coemansia spiralis]|nr:hypothetical protein BX070DRAFT_229504 [Coemansia spiralis]